MSDEYLNYIVDLLKKLKEDTGYVWSWANTGGGCDALFLHFNGNNEDDGYYMVTHDASVPTNDEEWSEITLGKYNGKDLEAVDYFDVRSYAQLVRFISLAPKLSQWKFA